MMAKAMVTAGLLAAVFASGMAQAQTANQPDDAPARPAIRQGGGMALPATRDEAIAKARERFAAMDRNGDGVVTRDELSAPPEGRDSKGRMRGAMMAMMFDRIDANGDGRITLQEAEAFAASRFDRADTDHDGTLSQAERDAARPNRMMRRGESDETAPPQ